MIGISGSGVPPNSGEPSANDLARAVLRGEMHVDEITGRPDIVNIQDVVAQVGQGQIPDRASELTLDAARKNEWGDPLPKLQFRDAPESVALRAQTAMVKTRTIARDWIAFIYVGMGGSD